MKNGDMKIFDRLRASNVRRTSDGFLGGVCSGLAHRHGVDPVIVRIVAVALMFFGAPVFLAYGLMWLLIPSFPDNRIVLDDSARGNVTAHLAGAIGSLVLGVWGLQWSADLAVAILDSGVVLPTVLVVAIVGVAIWLVRRRTRASQDHVAFASPADNAVSSPADSSYWPSVPAAETGPLHSSLATAPKLSTKAPKVKVSPSISGRHLLGTLAIVLVSVGVTLLATQMTFGGVLLAAGIGLLVVGASITIAGLRGKRATWLTFLSWLSAPAIALTTALFTLIPTPLLGEHNLTNFLDGEEHFTGANPVPSRSFIDDRTFYTEKLEHDLSIMAAGSSTQFNIPAEQSIIFTIKGSGTIYADTFGGWQISVAEQDIMTAPGVVYDRMGGAVVPGQTIDPSVEDFSYEVARTDKSMFMDTVTVMSPAAIADPASAHHITIDLGVGEVAINELAPEGLSGFEYGATRAGYTLEESSGDESTTEDATSENGAN